MPIIWLEKPVRTIEKILEELEAKTQTKWRAINGYQSLNTVELNETSGETTFYPNNGLILKSFINESTGEVKSFLVRYLDIKNQ